jgi:hypothetical protein
MLCPCRHPRQCSPRICLDKASITTTESLTIHDRPWPRTHKRGFITDHVERWRDMAKTDKPNILIIWGDDIGWFNVSCNNMGIMGLSHAEYRSHRQ